MISNIKNIFSTNKKRKILIFFVLFFVILSVVFSYVENNIQKIISNEFSKRSNYQMKLDDVDFNFSGNVSYDNIIIFNSNNDTLFYAPNLTIDPKSVQNAIVDNNYDFENITVKNGLFFIQNFE